jgi:hypothetical protein
VKEEDAVNNIVVTSSNRADRKTVAAGAGSAGEGDVFARVDGDAVILVLDDGTLDPNVVGITNVEPIRVVGQILRIGVLDVDVIAVASSRSALTPLCRILLVQTHSSRLVARMLTACSGVFWMFNPLMTEWLMLWSERTLECLSVQVRLVNLQSFRDILGLLLAAVATLTIPPPGTVALNDVTGRSLDGNSLALELDEESLKLLIVKSSRSSKSDLKGCVSKGSRVASSFMPTRT